MNRTKAGALAVIAEGLKPYGASLNEAGYIVNADGGVTGIKVIPRSGRLRFESDRSLQMTGGITVACVAAFVERFWYWAPIAVEHGKEQSNG